MNQPSQPKLRNSTDIFNVHLFCTIQEVLRRGKIADWQDGKYAPSQDSTFPSVLMANREASEQNKETALSAWNYHVSQLGHEVYKKK